MTTNKPYLLALNRIPTIGPRTIMALLEHWPVLEDMFKLSQSALQDAGLSMKMAAAICTFDMRAIDDDLIWEQTDIHHHIVTWEDDIYPVLLKEIYDSPPVLYAVGSLDSLQQITLAMVGTRKPSVSGGEIAWRFANELTAHHITIVSGLAHGIDAKSHEGCLAAKGKTIAVMGTGIDSIYPQGHWQLANKIKENGLLLTEFPLKNTAKAGHFPRRNRIISGLSLATLVVEAAIKSGSLITARLALEQNRDVLAIPGSIHNPQARGCHHLLQQGAKLVTSVHDILNELKIDSMGANTKDSQPLLMTDNQNLIKCIGFEVTTIDQIIQRSGLSIEKVTCNLAQLELQGVVKAVLGGYTRCILPTVMD